MATALKSRAGSARLGAPLMVLCFLGITGFLYWLSITAESAEVVVEESVEEEALVNLVAFADFSAATASYIGQEISLEGIPVASQLGPHSFWTSLQDAQSTAYLIHFSESLVADSTAVMTGASVTLTGTVTAMTDSVLDAWEAAGAFAQSTDRFQAEFAENFIEATMVDTGEAGADESGAVGAEDDEPSEPSS